ncbi:MAG: dihydrofolate reductase [Burkholderiales bacterium]
MRREEQNPDAAARLTPDASRLSIIVAMAENRVIGANGAIPWKLPNELQLFKRITMGHHIIMGRKTWESIGRLLPGRTTVIITRRKDYLVSGAIIANSLANAIEKCAGDDEIFVVGGGELYREALPKTDRLYLTVVDTEPAGDTHMPALNMSEWREINSETHAPDEKHAHAYRFNVYERVRT